MLLLVFIEYRVAAVLMLFAMVISFKAYEVKVQEIKRKAFSLNKRSTLYSMTKCHYIKKIN